MAKGGSEFMRERFPDAVKSALRRKGSDEVREAVDTPRKKRTEAQNELIESSVEPALLAWFEKLEDQMMKGENPYPFNFRLFDRWTKAFEHQESKKSEKRRRSIYTKSIDADEYGRIAGDDAMHDRRARTKEEMVLVLNSEQMVMYESWLRYLLGSDGRRQYEPWFRYFALSHVLKNDRLGRERHPDTTAGVLKLNQAALALVYHEVKELADKLSEARGAERKNLQKEVGQYSFHERYTHFVEEQARKALERQDRTDGWHTFTDPQELADASAGTPWCLAGIDVAQKYLQNEGDEVRVLFQDGRPKVGVHIREGEIREVRGADDSQNLDPAYAEAVGEELKKYQNVDRWKKQAEDTRMLGRIASKMASSERLNKEELEFLYELKSPIKSFGYKEDRRIKDLRSRRNQDEDATILLSCSPQEIAHSTNEITERTKVYIGPLKPGIFPELSHLEYVYTLFPEGRIRFDSVEIGGKKREQLERELEAREMQVGKYGQSIMQHRDFRTLANREEVQLVQLSVESLGFPHGATAQRIYYRAEELGLEVCPAEVGPCYRLKYTDQPFGELFAIGMRQIPDWERHLNVFALGHNNEGLWLDSYRLHPDDWYGDEFLFRLPAAIRS